MYKFIENSLIILLVLLKILYLYSKWFVSLFLPKEPKSLKGEVILITGSANGLGKEICKKLAPLGATLVLWDISQKENQETSLELQKLGAKHVFIDTVDVSSRPQIIQAVARLRSKVGPVTILVNNAGIAPIQPFLQIGAATVQKTFDINVLAPFWTIQEFLPEMIAKDKGHIVSICSVFSLFALRGASSYVATKHAVHGMLECLRSELSHHPGGCNVKLTNVYPFFIKTRMVMEEPSGMRLKFRFPSISPFMEADWVAGEIVDAIRYELEYLYLPTIQRIYFALHYFMPFLVNKALMTDIIIEEFGYPPSVSNKNSKQDIPIWMKNQVVNDNDKRLEDGDITTQQQDGIFIRRSSLKMGTTTLLEESDENSL